MRTQDINLGIRLNEARIAVQSGYFINYIAEVNDRTTKKVLWVLDGS